MGSDEIAAQHEPTGDRRGELVAHDFDRADRVRHADADLGESHLEVDVGDQPDVATQREHQSTGDGVTVDRPDHESRAGVHGEEGPVQGLDQLLLVTWLAVLDGFEIQPGTE